MAKKKETEKTALLVEINLNHQEAGVLCELMSKVGIQGKDVVWWVPLNNKLQAANLELNLKPSATPKNGGKGKQDAPEG